MAARLEWTAGAQLEPAMFAALIGPGAPFEMRTESVLGADLTVFAQRPRSVYQLLVSAAERFGDREYLVFHDTTLTYANVAAPIAAAATRLRNEFGVGPGDRVAIASANCAEYAITFWAATSLGAITVCLNGWWTPPELAFGITLSTPKVVFADERRAERVAEACTQHVPRHDASQLTTRADDASSSATFSTEIDGMQFECPVVRFDGGWWGDADPAATLPEANLAEDDPYLILFTSGTTGRPKGAVLSHRGTIHFILSSMATGAVQSAIHKLPPMPSPAVTVSSAPMFHVSGMTSQVIMAPASGMKVVYPAPGRWSEETHLGLTQEHRVTSWGVVPTQMWRLLDYQRFDQFDLSSLASVGGGSSIWPPELIRRIGEQLPHVRTSVRLGYGMTETTGLGTSLQPPLTNLHPDSVGWASAGVEVEVRDPDTGVVVEEGVVGEVCLRTAAAFLGYWNNQSATDAAIDAERWYRTGDFGVVRDGLLHLEGRRNDLIIRGGENIYPVEIENRLLEHAEIADAVVVGIDHPTLGQEVKAFVVRHDPSLTSDDVRAWVAVALASFKVPAMVDFISELPRNASGKVVKQMLIQPDQPVTFVQD